MHFVFVFVFVFVFFIGFVFVFVFVYRQCKTTKWALCCMFGLPDKFAPGWSSFIRWSCWPRQNVKNLPFLIHPGPAFLKSVGGEQYDWLCFAANKICSSNNLPQTHLHVTGESLTCEKKSYLASLCLRVECPSRPVLWSNEAISRLLAAFATFGRFSGKTKAERWPSPEAVLSSLYFA